MNATTIDYWDIGLESAAVFFSLIVMFIALRAYWAASRSADAAGRSADAAGRSADAAVETARITAIEHDTRMRPWLGLTTLECESPNWVNYDHWNFKVKNFGALPARNVAVTVFFFVRFPASRCQETTLGTIYPTQEKDGKFSLPPYVVRTIKESRDDKLLLFEAKYDAEPTGTRVSDRWVYVLDVDHQRVYPAAEFVGPTTAETDTVSDS